MLRIVPRLPRELFIGLFDDAAVFPPGNAPLDHAVAQHRAFRTSRQSDLVGPLLLPAASLAAAADLAGLADLTDAPLVAGADRGEPGPLDVVVIGRPGADPQAVIGAVDLAARDDRLTLCGVEIGWSESWRELDLSAPRIVLELPRGTEQALALTDIATALAEREGQPGTTYAAKFRTGATDTWDWPAERELARAIQAAVSMDVPLKLTGGLHHAVRSTVEGTEHHGVLNVLLAFAEARAGRTVAALTGILAQRDPQSVLAGLEGLGTGRLARIRADFPAYGCCQVGDPISELGELDALDSAL